ncbi:ABC transporter ATP-binding protein [Bacteriovorax stolpii]|uniref:Iron ABC transporter ATP-binding protein n=1 Tax=Bacteriovorax stolpii TaxID=960 RepID=A0A2K9NMR0_BACTC|nr:ABC transporter ATP-binding protein [Bacteriovorax stolpii]AUN96799.1 iron ABC transporter ATP-binding protein [Bacteriovorax stolpii]QDK43270.1 ABC transporter ATP-binding protein [Bacteriovorax stolpii]TDP53076.1 iron complex transport system ATP-binding protein [Bacteriovorax stolpii]
MITFNKLSVGFNHKTVLAELTGELRKGDLIALMGINGVGKSCFLKTITGLNPLIKGELSLDEKPYSTYSELDLAKKISVVLTDRVQVDYLRVSELIMLGRSPYTNFWGEVAAEDKTAVNDIIKMLNIESITESFFSDLSDGQKQRALLARALVQSPDYLFLDEPTTYLDIPSKIELMKILRSVSQDKCVGVLFSTHDLSLVENVVDQIWLIDSQGVLHKKSPEEMNRSGLLAKNFNL